MSKVEEYLTRPETTKAIQFDADFPKPTTDWLRELNVDYTAIHINGELCLSIVEPNGEITYVVSGMWLFYPPSYKSIFITTDDEFKQEFYPKDPPRTHIFKKKSEAVQARRNIESQEFLVHELIQWIIDEGGEYEYRCGSEDLGKDVCDPEDGHTVSLITREGRRKQRVPDGGWVVLNANGDFFNMSDEDFRKEYEGDFIEYTESNTTEEPSVENEVEETPPINEDDYNQAYGEMIERGTHDV